jgi:hypothetical protein
MAMILLLLRVIHLQTSHDRVLLPQLGKFPEMLWKNLDANQIKSAFDLFDYITTGSQRSFDPEIILRHTHDLLSLLVRHSIKSLEKIGCASDITLLLGSLLPDGRYQSANCLTKDCAMFCHGMVATIIHFVRLQELDAPHFSPHNAALFQAQFEGILSLQVPVRNVINQDAMVSGEDMADGDDGADRDDAVNDVEEEVEEDLGKDLEIESSQDLSDKNGDVETDQLTRCRCCF